MNERRSGPDFIMKVVPFLSVIAWILLLIALVLGHLAQPEMESGIVRFHQISVRGFWLIDAVTLLQRLILCAICLSVLGLLIAKRRSRRKSDASYINQKILMLMLVTTFTIFYLNT